jgi:hypothetical protein
MIDFQMSIVFLYSSFQKYRKYKRLFTISLVLLVIFLITSIILGAFLIDFFSKKHSNDMIAENLKSTEDRICLSRACIKAGSIHEVYFYI